MKTPLFITCLLSLACTIVHAQQHPAAATTKRATVPANVAAGLLCGSSDASATAKDEQNNAHQHFGAGASCGPVGPPLYPAAAKQAGIQGTVTLNAVIGTDGTVRELHVIDGHPLLVEAAIEAVKRWKYRPYYVKGKPVEMETTVTVNFRLEKQ